MARDVLSISSVATFIIQDACVYFSFLTCVSDRSLALPLMPNGDCVLWQNVIMPQSLKKELESPGKDQPWSYDSRIRFPLSAG